MWIFPQLKKKSIELKEIKKNTASPYLKILEKNLYPF